jgi:AAHS family 3-hydroxyphenylpropionic acid transporter
MTRPSQTSIALGLCLLAAMIEGFDIASMGVTAPRMMPALGLSRPEAGLAFSASLMGLFFGAAIAGPLSDRIGRKPVLVVAMMVFGLFSLATAAAADLPVLLTVRALTGLGLGGAMPMLIAMSSELSRPDRRALTVGMITAGLPLGGALAGLLARTDLAQDDWRLVFVVGGAAPLVLAVLVGRFMPETREQARLPGDETDLAGPGLSGATALRALFAKDRLLATLCLWISYAAIALVLHLFLNWLPVLLVDRGIQANSAAGVATVFNLGGATGGLLIGLAIDRLGPRWPLASVFAALVAVLLVLAAPSSSLVTLSLLAFAAGLLIMAGQFGLYAIGPWYYADAVRGAGVGAAVAAGRLGSVLGPVAAGQMLGAGASGGSVVLFTAPIVVAAALAALILTGLARRA